MVEVRARQRIPMRIKGCVVFAQQPGFPLMARPGLPFEIFPPADGFVVNDRWVGSDDDVSAVLSQPQAQIHVVENHSQLFVESADGVKSIGLHEKACR